MFKAIKKLNQLGILGINRRNAEFIAQFNQRKFYPLVDNKLITKKLALKNNIPVPMLYHVIEKEHQINTLGDTLKKYDDFVIKPAQGSGGDGILVITGTKRDRFVKSNGRLISLDSIEHHVSNTLSGLYSLGGQPDAAFVEYRIQFDPLFAAISYQGVPDIRVLVFLGVPVMAMVRLPTSDSHGKANLHQGAVGLGIDLKTGKTTHAVWHDKPASHHPDTDHPLANLPLPNWEKLLTLAASCYELTQLGYLGVDIVLDKNLGPLMLELNARPGLSIQIANQQGLLHRLNTVRNKLVQPSCVEKRLKFMFEYLYP